MSHGRQTSSKKLIPKGKDELNLPDWRIGVPTHQQPLKSDGGKLDYIIQIISRTNGPDQKVTKMAPSLSPRRSHGLPPRTCIQS